MNKERRETAYREGYPEELDRAEMELLKLSRKARDKPREFGVRECTGVGLSGGGIRSATFSLGVFQGLAGLKLLSNIDIISTVSGGGYFGSFYTRFFMRKEVGAFDYVQQTLAACSPPDKDKESYQRNVITWLRENGRYLSPRGSGDLLLAGAVLLRNWMVVQIVLATLFLLLFLSAQLLRIPLDPWFHAIPFLKAHNSEMVLNLPGQLKVWMTPFVMLPIALFLLGAVPLGWAYWLVGRQPSKAHFWKLPVAGLAFVFLAALLTLLRGPDNESCRVAALGVLTVTILAAGWSLFAQAYGKHSPEAEDPTTGEKYRAAFKDNLSRHLVSAQLKGALVITLAAAAFAVVDSLGQTVYLVLLTPDATLKSWAGGLLVSLVALVPFATRIMISLRGANGGKRPKALSKIAAAAAASLIVATILTTFNVGANAIAWTLQRPARAPAELGKRELPKLSDLQVAPDQQQPNNWSVPVPAPQPEPTIAAARDAAVLWGAWGFTFMLSFLFGQSWPFLNRSTQLPLYSARLTRAYLGASNPRRFDEDLYRHRNAGGAVTRVIPGDDIDTDYYWPWPPLQEEKRAELDQAKKEIYQKGTPLHLVNVTINETLDSKSQVQQQDRKGIGMALGPAGISAGIRHHVVFDRARGRVDTFPKSGFRMFDYGEAPQEFVGERLSLGQWLAISGAAFSTGLGARTNLAFSLLTGISNIRLGYWWDSGIVPEKRPRKQRQAWSQKAGSLFTYLFPVQSYLLDEYTARYHGTARQHWNLSDGGHFENMGGYELIRRRLRLIIIIDAEADPDYNFGGLADLIRKARIDFGAEIKFLEDCEVNELMAPGHKHCFSALENLRRGKLIEESLPLLNKKEGKRQLIDPVDHQRYSLAHAALARVCYDCGNTPESALIYIKPGIVGDEPLDVLQYHVENPSFPQQTTIDQFFDEAQWESYRTLGEHIATEVFRAPQGEDQTAWWGSLVDRMLQEPCPGGAGKSPPLAGEG